MFRRKRKQTDFNAEVEVHLELETERLKEQGMSDKAARMAARRAFGNVTRAQERFYESSRWVWWDNLVRDIRFGLRQLRRNPGFTIVAVLTLALGIGANVAIFSLLNQMLLRSLPVEHPEELVVLSSTETKAGSTDFDYDLTASFSYPMYKDLRDKNRVFSGLLACYPSYTDNVNVSWRGHVDRANAALVSGNFFQVLGARPELGRVFWQEDETAPGANPVAVLSYRYWAQHFGGNPAVLNQTLDINATPLTVVGVAQPGFNGVQLGWAPDLYIPITMMGQMMPNWNGLDNVSDYFLPIVGRLAPGMSPAKARAGLQPVFRAVLESELPIMVAKRTITSAEMQKGVLGGKIELTPGARGRPVFQEFTQPLALVMAMVGLVLLIACANLAGLLLARGEARQHEISVRLAMGASRARLVRQLLTENLIVATAGGAASLLVGWWALRAILSALSRVPLVALVLSGLTANLDPRVVAFAAAVTILSLLFFGLLPTLKATRADLQTSLKEQGAGASGGAESVRLRKLLVVAQVASTTTLLVAAALFGESLVRLERANLGMNIGHVIQLSLDPGLSHYSPAQTVALFNRLRQDIAALPGVASVSAAEFPLLADSNNVDTMTFEGHIPGKDEDTTVSVNSVGPHFFSTLGIPIMLGREFREGDSASSPKVAIINEKVAQKFFPGRNPIGMHLVIGWGPSVHPDIEIVGMVANAKAIHPRDTGQPFVYFPYAQDSGLGSGTFYVRTFADPGAMAATLRKAAAQDAANLPVYDARTVREQFNNSMAPDRLLTFFTLALALLAAMLAAIGLYGVMAYVVIRRTREIAIRMALGAAKSDVLKHVIGMGLQLAVIGLAIGILGALGLARLLASLLYGVKPTDPLAFVAVSLILIAVAAAACYIPARRVMKIDPMVALRYE